LDQRRGVGTHKRAPKILNTFPSCLTIYDPPPHPYRLFAAFFPQFPGSERHRCTETGTHTLRLHHHRTCFSTPSMNSTSLTSLPVCTAFMIMRSQSFLRTEYPSKECKLPALCQPRRLCASQSHCSISLAGVLHASPLEQSSPGRTPRSRPPSLAKQTASLTTPPHAATRRLPAFERKNTPETVWRRRWVVTTAQSEMEQRPTWFPALEHPPPPTPGTTAPVLCGCRKRGTTCCNWMNSSGTFNCNVHYSMGLMFTRRQRDSAYSLAP
jgi:hypothetical protein